MLVGSVLAYRRSLRRVAINAALAALASGFFVVAMLGGLPINNADTLARFLAQVAGLVSVLLTYLLLTELGVLKAGRVQQRVGLALIGLGMATFGAGWMMKPLHELALGLATAGLLACVALAMSVLIISNPLVGGASALAMAKGMSLTAVSYASRIAWFDHGSGETVELPELAQS